MSVRIVPVPIPESATAAPSWQLEGVARVLKENSIEIWGNDDDVETAAELGVNLADQQSRRKLWWAAVRGDTDTADAVVACGLLAMPLRDNLTRAHVMIDVTAPNRRQGIATALWNTALPVARAQRRTIIGSWGSYSTEPASDDPDALDPPTGTGRVPLNDPGTQFLLTSGFKLEQAYRHSLLQLPVDPQQLQKFRAESEAAAGGDYQLITWEGPVPQQWIDSYCLLQTRMSTDAPSGNLSLEEEVWDAERVQAADQVYLDQGWRSVVTAALHRPSGELAGYTDMGFFQNTKPEVAHQDNTIVLKQHRGKRLGMLLKAANLQLLAANYPQVQRIHTWNAEENAYMLNINVALGFRPSGGASAWELKLTD